MQFELAFIKSKVAKRILTLFVLAAIIPISITGFISYKYMIELLLEQKQDHMSSESKSYGMAIFDRILVAESQLIGLGENLLLSNSINTEANNPILKVDDSNTKLFSNINVYKDSTHLLFEYTKQQHLQNGKTLITIKHKDNVNNIIFYRLISTSESNILLSAEVDKNYIFGDMDIFAGDDDACVISKNSGVLNCSNEKLNKLFLSNFDQYIKTLENTNHININNNKHLVASWELFLNGSYNTDSWFIYYTIPRNTIFIPINEFGSYLIPLLVLSILIISFISYNQITRILVPLEKLNLLTKKIAKRDFSEVLNFDTNDEFQNLGESFNLMSAELSRQFTVMTSMSNLDRAILTTMDKKNVVEAIFKNLKDYINYNFASIVLLEENTYSGILYNYGSHEKQLLTQIPIQISHKDFDVLLAHSDELIRTLQKDKIQSVKWLNDVLSNYVTTIAIKQQKEFLGLIIIGHQFIPRLNEEALEQLDNYIDRIKVALNAVEREEKLIKQAHFDSLTGLPNRELLIDTFNKITYQQNNKVAVLFIDLDRFKVINDSQGHAIGDKLLIAASERIKKCVYNKGFLARYGGDEFIVLLTFQNDSSCIAETAKKISSSLSEIFTIDNYEQFIGATIGISIYPKDGNNWDDILQKSDIAMYKAKESERGKYSFFSDAMQEDIREKALLEADLFHAIEKNELYMMYQIQIDIESGNVSGAESLIRWKHNKIGNISPEQFISYAEENGFIISLGTWVLREVIKQCRKWQFEHHPLPRVAVNISARQLKHDNFLSDVENLLNNFDIATTNIEFEITESLLLSDDKNILNKLRQLNELGISISIDDFGKGYSSLSYLKKLPVQTLKIDKLFVKDLAEDPESRSIVRAIIAMAKSLNKKVVAEGVETAEQLSILKELECDIAQGFYISKPKFAHDVSNYSNTAIIKLDEVRSKFDIGLNK